MFLFYLYQSLVITPLKKESARGVVIRLILDPNKDAFGLPKIGIPNRPVAYNLRKAGVETRWADTHGEQCHSKLMLAHQRGKPSTLILGSANFTRRNLDDFNLETSVVIKASRDSRVIKSVSTLFQKLWSNEENRYYTADYEKYHDTGRLRYLLYLLMEVTGISTF
jgi:phosphatidylserine/phosphatidylglycerophosphate/cardiolipin synthase-like enzyme